MAQDGHLDSHTAPELCSMLSKQTWCLNTIRPFKDGEKEGGGGRGGGQGRRGGGGRGYGGLKFSLCYILHVLFQPMEVLDHLCFSALAQFLYFVDKTVDGGAEGENATAHCSAA